MTYNGANVPISKSRDLNNTDPVQLTTIEQPYLIYPLGSHDTDPEDLIGFDGIVPICKVPAGSHNNQRAEVTIDIFDLAVREDLLRERSRVIESLMDDLEDEQTHQDPARRKKAKNAIKRAQLPGSEHSSCAKCFVALYGADSRRAKQLAERATAFLNKTIRRGVPPP